MTEFGQSSPALPQVYAEENVYVYSKAAFLSHLVRALDTVGMVAMRGLWPWDPIGSPEYVMSESTTPRLFPFDYPDTATFTVNNELWRPCIVVAAWFGEFNVNTGASEHYNDVCIFDAIRKDGAANLDNIYISERHRTTPASNYGWGTGTLTDYGWNHDGARVTVDDWLPYSGYSGYNSATLAVSNWYAYLGRSGLFLFAGTGSSREQFGDLLACGYIFGGGRIPNRELTVDANINRINPIIPLYLKSEGTGGAPEPQWNTVDELYESTVHGIQYDLKSQLHPVRCNLYNLENVEIPIFPFYKPWTAPSPRAISGGGGAHILGRLIQVPTSKEDNAGDLYGPIENSLATDETRPDWGEVFTAPYFRWCDLAAPTGLHEDPDTLIDWYLVPTYNTDQLIALYYENANVVAALATVSITLTGDEYYIMTGTPGLTFPNLGALNTPTVTNTTTAAGWSTGWDDTDTGDFIENYNDPAYGGSFAEVETEWTIVPQTGDPEDTIYRVSFDARNRDDASSEGTCPLKFDVYEFGAWVNKLTLNSAGTNNGLPGYTLTTYTYDVPVDSTETAQRQLVVRWQAERTNASTEGNTARVANVHVLKYRYL